MPTFTENSIQYTVSTLPQDLSTPLQDISTPPDEDLSTLLEEDATVIAHSWISRELQSRLDSLGKRINDENLLKEVIVELCSIKALKASEIADLLDKREDYIKRKYLRSMIERKQLEYTHPDMINHPHQAYAKGAES